MNWSTPKNLSINHKSYFQRKLVEKRTALLGVCLLFIIGLVIRKRRSKDPFSLGRENRWILAVIAPEPGANLSLIRHLSCYESGLIYLLEPTAQCVHFDLRLEKKRKTRNVEL